MRIDQTVEIDAPAERVWALLNDVPRVAPCMPGAQLTEVVDERTYEGTVRVKLGPMTVAYKGRAVLEEVDESARTAKLVASGRDVRGAGTAKATVDTKVEALSDTRTSLQVGTEVQLTGRVASFGRGAVQDVAAKLFGQFADCLRDSLESEQAEPASEPSEATEAGAGATAPPPAGTASPSARAEAEPLRAGNLAMTVLAAPFKRLWATVRGR